MAFSPELSKLLACTILLVARFSTSKANHEASTPARVGLEAARGMAAPDAISEPRRPGKLTFLIHGYEGVNEAKEFGPLKAEFEKHGFSCKIIRSPKTRTKTPNQDRARVMVEALKDVQVDIVLVGISNQGLFMPLVAAERPIRRIVMINAVVPTSGKSFLTAFDYKIEHYREIVGSSAPRALRALRTRKRIQRLQRSLSACFK